MMFKNGDKILYYHGLSVCQRVGWQTEALLG